MSVDDWAVLVLCTGMGVLMACLGIVMVVLAVMGTASPN